MSTSEKRVPCSRQDAVSPKTWLRVASSVKTANKRLPPTDLHILSKPTNILHNAVSAVITLLDFSRPRGLCLAGRVSSRAIFVVGLLIFTGLFTIEVVAQTTVPGPPSLIAKLAKPGDGKVEFNWGPPATGLPITNYEYSFSHGDTEIKWTSVNLDTSITITGLSNGVDAKFSIRARNKIGTGTVITITVKPTIAAPQGFKAAAGDGEVTLTWTAVPDVDTIKSYQYSKDDGTNWTSIPNSDKTTATHTVTGLTNGQAYTFKVRAVGAGGGGTASDSDTATPMLSPPAAPTGLNATRGDSQVTLSWQAPSGPITGYKYEQNGGDWTSTGWIPASGTSTTRIVTGLSNDISYTFRVRAVNSAGDGTPSNSAPAPLPEPPPPANPPRADPPPPLSVNPPLPLLPQPSRLALGAPENLQVEMVADTATNTAKAILTWNPPSNAKDSGDAIRYAYRYKYNPWTSWRSTRSSSTTYTVTGLDIRKSYIFEIGAFYADEGMETLSASNWPTATVQSVSKPTHQSVSKPTQRIVIHECPVGWTRGSVFGNTKKALLYELKVEADPTNRASIYQLRSIAIYVHPDENLETLDGWTLRVGTLYNQFGKEFELTAANAVIDEHNFAHIENSEGTPIPMSSLGFIGQSLPGFDYRLYDADGVRVDFGISCYKRGGLTYRLWNTADPRLLRVLPLGGSEEPLSVQMENLDWRTPFFRSEWTAAIMPDLPAAPAAPSLVKRNMVGTWADLKKQ